jgi:hypothetical protein
MDKGYDYNEVRGLLDEFGFTAHIRARGEEARPSRRAPVSRRADGSSNARTVG